MLTIMFNIVLFQPEIPPNTGNIIRLCVNAGARLHLIHPLGFELTDNDMRRAGLDYIEQAVIHQHDDFDSFWQSESPERLYGFSTKGKCYYHQTRYRQGDYLMFGPETTGLPDWLLTGDYVSQVLRLPMLAQTGNRSLNLNNTVAIALFEAWRQNDFMGSS